MWFPSPDFDSEFGRLLSEAVYADYPRVLSEFGDFGNSTLGSWVSTISYLETNNWIDEATRAVSLDFIILNRNTKLFQRTILLTEWNQAGGMLTSISPRVVPSDSTSLDFALFLIAYALVAGSWVYLVRKRGFGRILKCESLNGVLSTLLFLATTAGFIVTMWFNIGAGRAQYLAEPPSTDLNPRSLELFGYVDSILATCCIFSTLRVFGFARFTPRLVSYYRVAKNSSAVMGLSFLMWMYLLIALSMVLVVLLAPSSLIFISLPNAIRTLLLYFNQLSDFGRALDHFNNGIGYGKNVLVVVALVYSIVVWLFCRLVIIAVLNGEFNSYQDSILAKQDEAKGSSLNQVFQSAFCCCSRNRKKKSAIAEADGSRKLNYEEKRSFEMSQIVELMEEKEKEEEKDEEKTGNKDFGLKRRSSLKKPSSSGITKQVSFRSDKF